MICLDARLADNSYAVEIDAVLPRLLALADRDGLSPTRGVLDRQFWAWKLIDFPNATFQGAVNGLATLLDLQAFAPTIDGKLIADRIVEAIEGIGRITRGDGSLEEAFPFERSYCVTALVAFDVLKALDVAIVRDAVGAERADRVLLPLLRFLTRADETHGMISNHLATAAASLLRWEARTGDASAGEKGRVLIARILRHGSETEGWFSEYGGADPGYQTLCLTHLADIAASGLAPPELLSALPRAIRFVADFVHPDGSFGGIYGNRATRIFYPGGVELLASSDPESDALARRMRRAIARAQTVPLRAIDSPNLVPLFNSYCQALAASLSRNAFVEHAEQRRAARSIYEQAGLLVDRSERHHTIVSTRKGGVVYRWENGRLVVRDTGLVVVDSFGGLFTSQTDAPENRVCIEPDRIVVSGILRPVSHPLPGPIRFAALRLLAATVMRVPALGALIKRGLARYLITGRRKPSGTFERVVHLGDAFSIEDRWEPTNYKRVPAAPFSVIHMASQGYWQRSDDESFAERSPP